MKTLKEIGLVCAQLRRKKNISQVKVALELNYSVENISSFENGRNDNVRIFLWYMNNCITYDDLVGFMGALKDERKRHIEL